MLLPPLLKGGWLCCCCVGRSKLVSICLKKSQFPIQFTPLLSLKKTNIWISPKTWRRNNYLREILGNKSSKIISEAFLPSQMQSFALQDIYYNVHRTSTSQHLQHIKTKFIKVGKLNISLSGLFQHINIREVLI